MKKKSDLLNVIGLMLLIFGILSGWRLIELEPWNTRAYSTATQWVKENPQLTVVERMGKFEEIFEMPAYVDILRPRIFEKLIPKDVVLRVHSRTLQYWLYYPVADGGGIVAWFDNKPYPNVPEHVTLSHQGSKISADKIETTYATKVTPWWVLAVACPLFVLLAVGSLWVSQKS